ncbi:MAG: adenine phosphoribosyltransferase [Bdellovibrionales bacterium GWA2_49_15]|nr:MAG: adenine phosphoribosyltransferase [Bdellovibrionales bacterium GWA2_49_15]HAZ11268.1 adenine phosphoribosyltransferase [Bdellovibrionales bacterium]
MPIRSKIRTIPNYPKPGIMFRDITTLLKDREGFAMTIDQLCARYSGKRIDVIAGIEARGFIIGAAMALRMKLGFVPIRKKGKLPGPTIGVSYKLEYGEDHIEIHQDAIQKGERVLLVDDLIATGGTALGAAELIRRIGGELIEACFIVDLPELKGGEKLRQNGIPYFSLVDFEGE